MVFGLIGKLFGKKNKRHFAGKRVVRPELLSEKIYKDFSRQKLEEIGENKEQRVIHNKVLVGAAGFYEGLRRGDEEGNAKLLAEAYKSFDNAGEAFEELRDDGLKRRATEVITRLRNDKSLVNITNYARILEADLEEIGRDGLSDEMIRGILGELNDYSVKLKKKLDDDLDRVAKYSGLLRRVERILESQNSRYARIENNLKAENVAVDANEGVEMVLMNDGNGRDYAKELRGLVYGDLPHLSEEQRKDKKMLREINNNLLGLYEKVSQNGDDELLKESRRYIKWVGRELDIPKEEIAHALTERVLPRTVLRRLS